MGEEDDTKAKGRRNAKGDGTYRSHSGIQRKDATA